MFEATVGARDDAVGVGAVGAVDAVVVVAAEVADISIKMSTQSETNDANITHFRDGKNKQRGASSCKTPPRFELEKTFFIVISNWQEKSDRQSNVDGQFAGLPPVFPGTKKSGFR